MTGRKWRHLAGLESTNTAFPPGGAEPAARPYPLSFTKRAERTSHRVALVHLVLDPPFGHLEIEPRMEVAPGDPKSFDGNAVLSHPPPGSGAVLGLLASLDGGVSHRP